MKKGLMSFCKAQLRLRSAATSTLQTQAIRQRDVVILLVFITLDAI